MACLCFFVFRCVYREGSVIADMELRFNQEVGSSEVDALLSEVTKDGKIGDLEFSKLVPVKVVDVLKGQLFFQPRIRNGILTSVKFKSSVVLYN